MKYSKLLVFEMINGQFKKNDLISSGLCDFQKNHEYLILTSTYENNLIDLNRLEYFFENMFIYAVMNKFKKIDKIGIVIEVLENFNLFNIDEKNYIVKDKNVFDFFQDKSSQKHVKLMYRFVLILFLSIFLICVLSFLILNNNLSYFEIFSKIFQIVVIFVLSLYFFIKLVFKDLIPYSSYKKFIIK